MKTSGRDRRVRAVLIRGWGPYLALGMLVWGVEIATLVGLARALLPDVDLNSWTCITAATPPLLVALCVNFFVGTVVFVRAFARRKGRAKAVHYLFPEAEAGRLGVIGRILLKAAGVRAKKRAGVDSR